MLEVASPIGLLITLTEFALSKCKDIGLTSEYIKGTLQGTALKVATQSTGAGIIRIVWNG